jgi:hypothetical protein
MMTTRADAADFKCDRSDVFEMCACVIMTIF